MSTDRVWSEYVKGFKCVQTGIGVSSDRVSSEYRQGLDSFQIGLGVSTDRVWRELSHQADQNVSPSLSRRSPPSP